MSFTMTIAADEKMWSTWQYGLIKDWKNNIDTTIVDNITKNVVSHTVISVIYI